MNYGWMRHLSLGAIRFVPWDWQISLINLWQAGKSTVTLKSRQVGASWTAVAYANWLLNFHPDIELLLLSQKEEKAIKLLEKLTYFYERLPDWLRAQTVNDSRTNFSVAIRYFDDTQGKWITGNGSASSLTTTGTSGAGESARAVIVDEFALMAERNNDVAVWSAIAPTTIHGGQIVILSTPRGSYGEFYRIWNDSIEDVVNLEIEDERIVNYRGWNRTVIKNADKLEMVPTAIHYSMCYHDEKWIADATEGLSEKRSERVREHFKGIKYDTAWRDKQARRLKFSKDQVSQEFELEFDTLANGAFNTEDINACWAPLNKNPWLVDVIKQSTHFFIGVDTAEGITADNKEPDYNSITVFNQFGVQVYAEHNRENIDEWAGRTVVDPASGRSSETKGTVLKVIERFLPSTVIVEKNGPGLTVQNRIESRIPDDCTLIVLSMSGTIKPQLVSDFKAEMADEQIVVGKDGRMMTMRRFIFTDHFTVRCLRLYLKIGPGKFGAAPGFYDDPVVSCLWMAYAKRISDVYSGVAMMPDDARQDDRMALEETSVEDARRGSEGPAVLPQVDTFEGIAAGAEEISSPRGGLGARGGRLGGRHGALRGRG